jgi:hypothetical protein
MKQLIYILPYFFVFSLFAQTSNKSFELRYFTNDEKANGETDFKGETEWMDTEQRVAFLTDYADYASRFFENPNFDKKVTFDKEIDDLLEDIKPQPLTKIRQTILLNNWKAFGFKEEQDVERQKELTIWQSYKGASIDNGALMLENTTIERKIDSLIWRFKFETSLRLEENSSCSVLLNNERKQVIVVEYKDGELAVVSDGKTFRKEIANEKWLKLEVEGDFTQKRFNLFANGELLFDYIPMADTSATCISELSFQTKGKIQIDNLFLFNHKPIEDLKTQYASTVVIDQDFKEIRNIDGWQKVAFNDRDWDEVNLPSAHGGEREKGECYYLRKKISIGDFERATLQLETLDPGGEVWINNQVVAVINNRHPVELDVTNYLKPNMENLLAVKVKPNKSMHPMHHAPSDIHIGWFLGRAKLLLSDKCMIKDALLHTESIGNPANQSHKIHIQNKGMYYFEGGIEINYYPWFPTEGRKVASYSQKIQVRPGIANEFEFKVPVYSPMLWTCNSPALYKVEIVLKDKEGNAVDDYVTTTGIRVVGQKNGDFYFNNKPEMLNGAQIMGFRTPIETISKNNRCAPNSTVVDELQLIKKMGGNLLRMHVHAQNDTTDGINDPRYAEIADQLGVCLIWQTAGWVRNGEAWNVDFDGFPEYMKQVYNHPSIVMWEAGNHPNLFKQHDIEDTHDYITKCYNTIYTTDQSRLISPTSFWQHLHYANYEGTLDYKGNKIKPVPEYMAELNTRGSQDAYAGYGHEWSSIRKAPNNWAASCLAAKDKAYFNFEHEESIGQPNWELCKGKSWYLLQSYEYGYDEGSIGRKLTTDEWKASQAWQAFSAWESMKKQILLGYDGFSWCCLHGGANMGAYKKPLIDCQGHPKLAFYTNKMVFQSTWAGSNNVDVVYGPEDKITPVINHLGDYRNATLMVQLKTLKGKVIQQKEFKNIDLNEGHSFTEMEDFQFLKVKEGVYVIAYEVIVQN